MFCGLFFKGGIYMSEKYDYGILEDKLIELFLTGAPDFKKAEELIARGADLNAARLTLIITSRISYQK